MAIAPLRLPRLPLNAAMADAKGNPTPAFQRYWQTFANAIEASVNSVIEAQNAADAAQSAAEAAQTAAEAAQDAADQALAGGGTMSATLSLQLSQPLGIEITALDLGGSVGAEVTITSHLRRYGNGDQVAVTGGTRGPFVYDTTYYLYYDDPTREGGIVAYQDTSVEATAYSSTTNPDRHYVGSITMPSDGGPGSVGTPGTRS